jgi:putative ABC transport system permease protein
MSGDSVRAAAVAVAGNLLRTLLTALSIAVGVASVVVISSLCRSALVSMAAGLEAIGGAELLVVFPKRARGPRARYARPLTVEDAAALEGRLAHARWISGQAVLGQTLVTAGVHEASADLVAGDARLVALLKLKLHAGRGLTASDSEGQRPVVLVSQTVATALFGTPEAAIGQSVRLRGDSYIVVGVLGASPAFAFEPGYDLDNLLLIPRSRMVAPHLSLIMVGTEHRRHNAAVGAAIAATLGSRHDGADDVRVVDFAVRMESWQQLLVTLELVAAAVAAVALLAGAAGTMNVLLVSLHEQVREIAVRKALGARNASITRQFLLQGCFLAALGAGVGLAAGWGLFQLASRLAAYLQPDWVAALAVRPAALAVTAAFLVTMAAALLPAWRGRRLTIVDGLRARG